MKPIEEVKKSNLVDANGFVDVCRETLQHKKFKNIYGIGDCANLPSKVKSQNPLISL